MYWYQEFVSIKKAISFKLRVTRIDLDTGNMQYVALGITFFCYKGTMNWFICKIMCWFCILFFLLYIFEAVDKYKVVQCRSFIWQYWSNLFLLMLQVFTQVSPFSYRCKENAFLNKSGVNPYIIFRIIKKIFKRDFVLNNIIIHFAFNAITFYQNQKRTFRLCYLIKAVFIGV